MYTIGSDSLCLQTEVRFVAIRLLAGNKVLVQCVELKSKFEVDLPWFDFRRMVERAGVALVSKEGLRGLHDHVPLRT